MTRTVGLVSLGCVKNQVDSEMILGTFRAAGYAIEPDPAKARIIVINTCGFIESAKQESIDAILEMARYKQSGLCELLMVTGCLAQRYGAELREGLPEVDAFLGVNDYASLLRVINLAASGEKPLRIAGAPGLWEAPRVLITPPYRAYVRISDGCDNRCSYCAIPQIRGPYRSRPFEDVVKECEALATGGVTELTLIAQDSSRYGDDLPGGERQLPKLLRHIAAIDALRWVRVLYTYPDSVDEALLETLAGTPKVAKYLDIPLQHIGERLLRDMNRRGTPERIKRMINRCRELDITLRTTMIVGFPGETIEEFEELLDFVRWARFDRLGAFVYSPEEGTAAEAMPGQVDVDEKTRRLDRLMRLQQSISLELGRARTGEVCEVLVEGFEDFMYIGRSRREAPESDGVIRFIADRELNPGEYVSVKILDAQEYDLTGEMQ